MNATEWLAANCLDCPHPNGQHGPDGCQVDGCTCEWKLSSQARFLMEKKANA